jgi:hypothetical protein
LAQILGGFRYGFTLAFLPPVAILVELRNHSTATFRLPPVSLPPTGQTLVGVALNRQAPGKAWKVDPRASSAQNDPKMAAADNSQVLK